MMLLNTKPVIKKVVNSSNIIRKISFEIINHPYFEIIILIVIILNTITLSMNWYRMSSDIEFAL